MAEKQVGTVTHYFRKIGVAGIKLSDTLKQGDTVRIRGATTDFEQVVESMELEHQPLSQAQAGQEIGLKVRERVRRGDKVFKVTEEG